MTTIHSNNMQQRFGVEDNVSSAIWPKMWGSPLGKKTFFSLDNKLLLLMVME